MAFLVSDGGWIRVVKVVASKSSLFTSGCFYVVVESLFSIDLI